MEKKHPQEIAIASLQPRKIYVTFIGSTKMASFDALMLSLDRFKNILSSDSAKSNFETSVRSIQPTLTAVDAFIDAVYAEKKPAMAVTMMGRTLIVEVQLSENEFLSSVNTGEINKILSRVIAVGSMPAKKSSNQIIRDYTVFSVTYTKGIFIKSIVKR